jgi:endonuclease YncB( thermonuclease family)
MIVIVAKKSLLPCVVMTIVFSLPNISSAWRGLVVGIADNDTIKVMRYHKEVGVRLCGIDRPEKGQELVNWGNDRKGYKCIYDEKCEATSSTAKLCITSLNSWI